MCYKTCSMQQILGIRVSLHIQDAKIDLQMITHKLNPKKHTLVRLSGEPELIISDMLDTLSFETKYSAAAPNKLCWVNNITQGK